MARQHLAYLRNGELRMLEGFSPRETLLDHLRLREGCRGTKEGCNEGDCGACTVALGRVQDGRLVYEPVNSCILLLGQIDGKDLVTVEDLAEGDRLHPVQQALVNHHGSQCGFCTPGFVMSLFTLFHSDAPPDRDIVNDWLAGNLCRCTGYRPIVDAAIAALSGPRQDVFSAEGERRQALLREIDPNEDLFIGTQERFFAAPASRQALVELLAQHQDALILSGGTDVGLWITKQLRDPAKIVHTGRARDLAEIAVDGVTLTIGGGATYAEAEEALRAIAPDVSLVLRRLGSRQVRATGTIGGNIANGSPIGDMPPMLIALDAQLELLSASGQRHMELESFFLEYGRQDRRPGELVSAIRIPHLQHGQHFRAYKISKRFDQDISALLGAFRLTVIEGVIAQARIAYGGMAGVPKRANTAESMLAGCRLDDADAIARAGNALERDFTPISDMRASAAYRMQIAKNLLRKAVLEISGRDGLRVFDEAEHAA